MYQIPVTGASSDLTEDEYIPLNRSRAGTGEIGSDHWRSGRQESGKSYKSWNNDLVFKFQYHSRTTLPKLVKLESEADPAFYSIVQREEE